MCYVRFAAGPLRRRIRRISHKLSASTRPAGRVVLAVAVAGGLWWGHFAYGLYLSMAAVKNGDKRLLKRGKAGTAVVLSAKATNEIIQSGEFAWEAPRVYKYRLKVSLPGRSAYEPSCSICAAGIREGSVLLDQACWIRSH